MLMLLYHSLEKNFSGTEEKEPLDKGFGGYADSQGEEERWDKRLDISIEVQKLRLLRINGKQIHI